MPRHAAAVGTPPCPKDFKPALRNKVSRDEWSRLEKHERDAHDVQCKAQRVDAPSGFQLPVRPVPIKGTLIVTTAVEEQQCRDYVKAVNKWWKDVHKKWEDKCGRWRRRHRDLVVEGELLGLPPPEPLVLPPEPKCPVPLPDCVRWRIDELVLLPIEERARQCRTGVGGHAALVIARNIVLESQRADFVASDTALEEERAAFKKAETARLRALDEVGPNGETLKKYHKEFTTHKSGGKGRTEQVEEWVLNEEED